MAALRRVPSFTNFNPQGLKVLLVEGDKKARHAADVQLKQCSYSVTGSSSCLEALALLSNAGSSAGFDVLLVASSALQAKGQDATKLMKLVKQQHMPFILMAECSSKPDEVMLGIKLGADDILEKPLCPLKLKNIWQHTVRRMMRSSSSKDMDMLLLDHAGHHACCSSESGSPRRNNAAAAAATACHLLIDSPPTISSPVHPTWGADNTTAASSPVLGLLMHSNAASTFGSPARSGDVTAAAQQGGGGTGADSHSSERRSTKRKSKEYSSAPRCSSAAANNNNGSSGSPRSADAVVTGIIPPSTPAPSPLPAAMMMSPAAASPVQWPAPAPPTANLPAGMAWGMPMNPVAVAPGITPPIFPSPSAVPPRMLLPMHAAAGWPMPGMMPPPMCGMPGLGMPQFPMCGMPPMCSLGMAPSLHSQLPALPMHMLMDACGSGANNCGMSMHPACGMMGGCGMDSMQAACMAECMASPCSPCSDPSQDAAFSGKSAQDTLALDADDIGYIQTLQPSSTTLGKMMPRCESNQLLPSLEDLIADNHPMTARTNSNAASACNAVSAAAADNRTSSADNTAMLDPMDLELEALSLGCLGLRRTDSLEDIISRTIEVF